MKQSDLLDQKKLVSIELVEVDGKTLVIVVDGPAWITQLRFLKPQLLKKIDARVGKGLITDLRFVLGNGESRWQGERGMTK